MHLHHKGPFTNCKTAQARIPNPNSHQEQTHCTGNILLSENNKHCRRLIQTTIPIPFQIPITITIMITIPHLIAIPTTYNSIYYLHPHPTIVVNNNHKNLPLLLRAMTLLKLSNLIGRKEGLTLTIPCNVTAFNILVRSE